jgi:uncharacterized iron-regulated membrane protein
VSDARLKRGHKWIGLLLLVPLLVWTATGLLFALKPGWGPAYEYLSPWQSSEVEASALSLAAFASTESGKDASAIELHASAIGPVFHVERRGADAGSALYRATDGERLDPLSSENARALMLDAVARSSAPRRYGVIESEKSKGDTTSVVFAGGPRVTIDRHSGSIRQKGPDTDRINWYYKLHYMQWTGNASIDRILGFAAIVLVWLLAAVGLLLAWRSRSGE